MSVTYQKIIKKINQTIKKKGIPAYIKKWTLLDIPEELNEYSYMNFIKFLTKYVKKYHPHSYIISKKRG